jgi:hypothetical protein
VQVAISKRLRYEILRRDNFACRYCGATADDAKLVVDAVVPEALGGSHKDPSNLRTACEPCNSGKTSTSPDAPLVAEVAQDALRWSQAMAQAAEEMLGRHLEISAAHRRFAEVWDGWTYGADKLAVPKDAGWKQTVDALLAAGLPMALLEECIQIAMSRVRVTPENTFRYMCGVAWNKVTELQEAARRIADGDTADESPATDRYEQGQADLARRLLEDVPGDDVKAAIEAVDDRDYCRAHGEHVKTDAGILADAAEYVFSTYRFGAERLEERIFLSLLAIPDGAAERAYRVARTELYEHLGTDFDRSTFLIHALRHLEDELRFPQAQEYLQSLPGEAQAEWLAFTQALTTGRPPGPEALVVRAALHAQGVADPRHTYRDMCSASGTHIPMCPARGTYYVKLTELECCGPDGLDDHEGHLVCEPHLERLIDGTYTGPGGKRYTVSDFAEPPDDVWAAA